MKNLSKSLNQMAEEIRKADLQMAEEVRQNARESQEASRRMLEAIHRLHRILFLIPEKLIRIAEAMERTQ